MIFAHRRRALAALTIAHFGPAVAAGERSPNEPLPDETPPGASPRSRPRRPHIVMAMIDDLGFNGLNLHGHNAEAKSPHIEALASDGVVLDNYYVYKFCAPSRAAFLTGRVPGHGIWEANPSDAAAVGVNLNATMIPAMLRKAGYRTHQIGKWHQGYYARDYLPRGRGFDTSFGFLVGGSDHFTSCHDCSNGIPPPDYADGPRPCPPKEGGCNLTCPVEGGVDLWRDDGPAYGENGTYTAYLWGKEAVRVIDGHPKDGAPMFMYLALHNVHQPVEAPPEFLREFPEEDYNATTAPRRYYNAMAFSVDAVLANVTAALKRNGMYDNTVLVISTDNGGSNEHAGQVPGSSNYPLRGYKYSYFEGGIRGVGLVHSPLLPRERHGTHSRALLHVTDWYVSFCRLAGLESCADGLDEEAPLDGVDAWGIVRDGKEEDGTRPPSGWADRGGPQRDELILGVGRGLSGAFRQGDMKLIVGGAGFADGWSARYPGSTPRRPPPPGGPACRSRPCLFDLRSDPGEERDLAEERPDVAARMLRRYGELAEAMDVPNGGEDRLAELVWDGAYHVPRRADRRACDVVRKTGFWGPWADHLRGSQDNFFGDGSPLKFQGDNVVLV